MGVLKRKCFKLTFILHHEKIQIGIPIRVLVDVHLQLHLLTFRHLIELLGYKDILKGFLEETTLIPFPQFLEGRQTFNSYGKADTSTSDSDY